MKYDFTTYYDRTGKDSIAANLIPYDVTVEPGFSHIPMWVADMSFVTAPCVTEALSRRISEPHFGYFSLPDAYFDAILRWHRKRKGVSDLTREMIGYENSVLGGVAAAVSAFTSPGEKIFLHSPTYVGFTKVLAGLGRPAVHSELVRDKDGIWRMDYADMEKKIRENKIHFVIFCSPHNPCGRVWEREEIETAMAIYRKYDCLVISDEIWSDIVMPGYRHIPTQSVSEDAKARTIAFYAPSKTFSLAGLVGSYHVIYNETLRDRLDVQSASTHYNEPNILSVHALIGAYSDEGMAWADEMVSVIDKNFEDACRFFGKVCPEVRVMRPQGTYMLYLDCGEWCRKHGISADELRARAVKKGVIWQRGDDFLMPDTIRMNLSLPNAMLAEALERLKKYVFA